MKKKELGSIRNNLLYWYSPCFL